MKKTVSVAYTAVDWYDSFCSPHTRCSGGTARIDENVKLVTELALSHENAPGRHRTVNCIHAKEGIRTSDLHIRTVRTALLLTATSSAEHQCNTAIWYRFKSVSCPVPHKHNKPKCSSSRHQTKHFKGIAASSSHLNAWHKYTPIRCLQSRTNLCFCKWIFCSNNRKPVRNNVYYFVYTRCGLLRLF